MAKSFVLFQTIPPRENGRRVFFISLLEELDSEDVDELPDVVAEEALWVTELVDKKTELSDRLELVSKSQELVLEDDGLDIELRLEMSAIFP